MQRYQIQLDFWLSVPETAVIILSASKWKKNKENLKLEGEFIWE